MDKRKRRKITIYKGNRARKDWALGILVYGDGDQRPESEDKLCIEFRKLIFKKEN